MTTASKSAPLSVWRPIATDTFLVGAPHYPEHVDESYWQRDADRMAAAGFNTVRLAEFAWHILEPHEGTFDFDLFDRAIDVLGKAGIKTIMCTPTATPPRWLTARYPEVLRVDANGRAMSHGSRQHANLASGVFREHSKRITKAMAEHYRGNSHIIGWQTDNELNTSGSLSYGPVTLAEFQAFLKDKYKTIAALNDAWGGHFWATAYDDFDQVVLPLDYAPAPVGPTHVVDYHRFLAFVTARFQHDQVLILRATNPDWFVFHNLGRIDDIDFRGEFSTDLDFLGFDIYPHLYDEMQRVGGVGEVQALHLDICRGFTGNFIVPEQQSGFGAQPHFSTLTPEPGEMRRMAYTSVARGADGVMFFRWRPAHFGAEIYWMGIIDHDDIPRRRYDEAKQFAGEVTALKDKILGTHVRMDLGIAGSDFDNQEMHRSYPIGMPSPQDDATLLHRYCYRHNIACGFIHPEDDLIEAQGTLCAALAEMDRCVDGADRGLRQGGWNGNPGRPHRIARRQQPCHPRHLAGQDALGAGRDHGRGVRVADVDRRRRPVRAWRPLRRQHGAQEAAGDVGEPPIRAQDRECAGDGGASL